MVSPFLLQALVKDREDLNKFKSVVKDLNKSGNSKSYIYFLKCDTLAHQKLDAIFIPLDFHLLHNANECGSRNLIPTIYNHMVVLQSLASRSDFTEAKHR